MKSPSNFFQRHIGSGFVAALPLAAVVACGGSEPTPVTPAATPVETAAQAAKPPQPPTTPPVARVAAVDVPSRVACRFEHTGPLESTWKVRLGEAKTAPYASIAAPTKTSIDFPVGKANAAFVTIEAGAVTVRGWVDNSDVPLYPQRADVLRGTVVPFATAPLELLDGAVDSLHFKLPIDSAHAKVEGTDAVLPCAYFGTTPGTFDAATALPAGKRVRVAIRPGSYPLYKDLTGADTVGSLTVDANAPYAFAVGGGGARTLVAWPVAPSLVFGWLERKDAAMGTETVATNIGTKSDTPKKAPAVRETGVATFKEIRCDREVPLAAEVAGNAREIGAIHAGERFQVGPDVRGFTLVAFPGSDLLVSDSGKLIVETAKLAACK